jgi:hypothetical protein
MMKRILIFSLVLVLAAVSYTAVLAQDEPEILACPDGVVSGTIVGYDEETGVVTLDVEGVLCTVTLSGDYDHPIVNLLGAYFAEINTEDIADSLDALQVCAVFDGENYTVTAPNEEGTCDEGELVTVTGVGVEGGFEAQTETGETINFDLEDEEAAGALADALNKLQADWEVEDGGVGDAGDEIGALHDDGYGFGTLVKVYAIADEAQQACADQPAEEPAGEGEVTEEVGDDEVDPCDVSVEFLLEELDGMGMGQIFQVYGKPSIVGIGHVRQIGEGEGTTEGNGNSAKGICNARAHGGKANANGQPNVNCDDADSDTGGDQDGGEDPEGDG